MRITPHSPVELGVVVVAAGSGERLGAGVPKAFVTLRGRTLIEHAIRTVTRLSEAGQLVLVVPADHAAEALELTARYELPEHWTVSIAHGGRERHESVRFGLEALHDSIGTVLVHDAARPLTPTSVFERVIEHVRRSGDSIIPVQPLVDTVKRVDADGVVLDTLPRDELVAVQTPQGFPRETLTTAHTAAHAAPASGADVPTDDAELVQRAGGLVRTIEGSPYAHKLTVPADLRMLEALFDGTVS